MYGIRIASVCLLVTAVLTAATDGVRGPEVRVSASASVPDPGTPRPPRVRLEAPSRSDRPGGLIFRDLGGVGRTLRLQRKLPPGPWTDAGLVPAPETGVSASLPEPAEPVVLYRLVDPSDRLVVRQDFRESADTEVAKLPDPEVGFPWRIRGIGWTEWTMVRVRDGMVVDENPTRQVSYLGQALPANPSRVEATVEWKPFFPDGDREAVFVIALCRNPQVDPWFADCIHVRLHRGAAAVDVVDGGRMAQGRQSALISPALAVGVRHHFAVERFLDRIRVHVDGRTVIDASDPDFLRQSGPAVFWEIYSDPGRRRLSGVLHGVSAEVPRVGSGLSDEPPAR